LRDSNTPGAPVTMVAFGHPSYRFLPGDWNGDGTDTVGVTA
jgi:hypothetical protein